MNGRGAFLLEVVVAIAIVWFFFEEIRKRNVATGQATPAPGSPAVLPAAKSGCCCGGKGGATQVVNPPVVIGPGPGSHESPQPPAMIPPQAGTIAIGPQPTVTAGGGY